MSRLHRDLPGCRSVLFGDTGTGIVLRACADADLRQEDHDSCMDDAADWLGPNAEQLGALVFGTDSGDARVSEAILLDGSELRVFRRYGENSCDVICVRSGETAGAVQVSNALRLLVNSDG
ncbi:hypothetical protein [Tropicimonas sp. TH_r6]|uniref:hypothetical protein n=1 Tax=Tropicimonas sp. TH_r6 TaxID=3082085 RepID=UPI002954DAB0|nr:hypothetical protein [Tropicimonas sp. TH_r6]